MLGINGMLVPLPYYFLFVILLSVGFIFGSKMETEIQPREPGTKTITCPDLINKYIKSLGFETDTCECNEKRRFSKQLENSSKMVISIMELGEELRVELRVDMVKFSKHGSERLLAYPVAMDSTGKISVSELMRALTKIGATAIVYEQSIK